MILTINKVQPTIQSLSTFAQKSAHFKSRAFSKLNLKFVIQHLLTNAAMRTHTKPNTNAFILLILKIVLLQNL